MEKLLREDIRFINKFLYSMQKHRIALKNWVDAKERDGINPSDRTTTLYDSIMRQETIAKRMAKDIVTLSPLWDDFFENISGVGESLATSLIAEIGDIAKFPTPSLLWAYAGLIGEYVKATCSNGHKLVMASDKHKTCPVFDNEKKEPCGGEITIVEKITGASPKRIKGHHYLFNSKLKMICWKISEQMIKQGDDFYREIYYKEKEKQTQLNPSLTKMHIHNRAKRKMVKIFLVHLWEAWREAEKLEIRTPYVIEKLGHQGYVAWAELKQLLIEGREKLKRMKEDEEKIKDNQEAA